MTLYRVIINFDFEISSSLFPSFIQRYRKNILESGDDLGYAFSMRTAIWITGLPGSGKSTLADAFKAIRPEFVILRMDELRKVATPDPSYSEGERDILYRSLVFMAQTATELGHDLIIDATGNRRAWRELARQLIPGYVEVYLRCPLEACRGRERQRPDTHAAPRDIYDKGRSGWPVPGVNAPYEEPAGPEITIETDRVSVNDAAALINDFLKKAETRRQMHGTTN